MGRLRTTPGFHGGQRNQHRAFFSSIHRATVTDISSAVSKGTVDVWIESTDVPLYDVLAPLMSLSTPPKAQDVDGVIDKSDDNGAKAAWGRYIPQVGDVLLIGFDTNGEPYSLGYHATYFKAMDIKDKEAAGHGGTGWGEESGIKLEPGDWDFMSKRNSRLMLTDKAQLSSGPHMLMLDKEGGAVTLSTTLEITKYGSASEERQGSVRRFLLPTDTAETDIYGIFGSIAQESTNVVKCGTLINPLGTEMARTSLGEVIDEKTFLPMVPKVSYPTLNKLLGTGTRVFRSVKDPTGKIDLFTELVDNLGNYGVSAKLSTAFQWNTPLSTWTILNAATDWTSSADFSITSINATITAAQVALGGISASGYLVNGTIFMPALSLMLTKSAAQFTGMAGLCVGPLLPLAAGFTAVAAEFTAFNLQLTSFLSKVSKTV